MEKQTIHDWEWFLHGTYTNADDWGMLHGIVLPCFTSFLEIWVHGVSSGSGSGKSVGFQEVNYHALLGSLVSFIMDHYGMNEWSPHSSTIIIFFWMHETSQVSSRWVAGWLVEKNCPWLYPQGPISTPSKNKGLTQTQPAMVSCKKIRKGVSENGELHGNTQK